MAASGFLDSISPWTSRSTTPKLDQSKGSESSPQTSSNKQQAPSHAVSRRHWLSVRTYPDDCPKSTVRWYYAVDFPKRKPVVISKPSQDSKALPAPKKYVAFSVRDSRSIESAFQKLCERDDDTTWREPSSGDSTDSHFSPPEAAGVIKSKHNTSINDSSDVEKGGSIKVPVNEDYLFDVDVERRELAPAYWLGPIYDVRRGSWFYQEGSSLRPCDENLANQLEEGYLKVKPWCNKANPGHQSSSRSRSRPTSMLPTHDVENFGDPEILKKSQTRSFENLKNRTSDHPEKQASISEKFELQSQRLFGAYMNSVVTYQDATVAWLLTDDFLSRMSSTVYQRFAGGGHLGGVKVVRGYIETSKPKEKKKEVEGSTNKASAGTDTVSDSSKKRSTTLGVDDDQINAKAKLPLEEETERETTKSEPRLLKLEKQMSSLVSSPGLEDPAQQDEAIRKRDEEEIQEDYQDADGEDQGREIEHLILVTHGIGQRLGLRMESVNFIHDVNIFRKTLKSVYGTSPNLQALNDEVEKLPKNCRLQVLPVVWRHLLNFPKQSFKENGREQDLADANSSGDEELYPSLDDITVEGVPAIRNLITDLALDILLYQSAYREHIAGIVRRECNRVHELFLKRNPLFAGKVSLVGHSLGSAILFDILCRQKDVDKNNPKLHPPRRQRSRVNSNAGHESLPDLGLNFEVEDFFCLGSPLGLYQMLKGCKIAGRKLGQGETTDNLLDTSSRDDPFIGISSTQSSGPVTSGGSELLSVTISYPKCNRLFNIFHPADPISYRIEPLISPAMSSLKPQPLPYTKKGIFGAPGQGITGIGTRVGQSVSGLWSNITSGVASSLLNRSLGLTGEGQLSASQSVVSSQSQNRLSSPGAGTNITSGGVIPTPNPLNQEQKQKMPDESVVSEQNDEHPTTLIDTEIETLYAGFQKHLKNQQVDEGKDLGRHAEWQDMYKKAQRLKREESKVRALNTNGRVDFSIQESMFDISLIASIASHLSYWADEDVSHFMISQLLAQQRVTRS